MKLRQILKRSLGVCFDFDGSKFVSSGDLLFVKYFIHKLSRYEFIQLRKCQRGVFQNHGVCGQAFPFLASPPPPRSFHQCMLRSPQFSCLGRAEKPTEMLASQASEIGLGSHLDHCKLERLCKDIVWKVKLLLLRGHVTR